MIRLSKPYLLIDIAWTIKGADRKAAYEALLKAAPNRRYPLGKRKTAEWQAKRLTKATGFEMRVSEVMDLGIG